MMYVLITCLLVLTRAPWPAMHKKAAHVILSAWLLRGTYRARHLSHVPEALCFGRALAATGHCPNS